jgi:hypothetical protein
MQILAGEWFDDPAKAHGRKKKSQNQELLVRLTAKLAVQARGVAWIGGLSSPAVLANVSQSHHSCDSTEGMAVLPFHVCDVIPT